MIATWCYTCAPLSRRIVITDISLSVNSFHPSVCHSHKIFCQTDFPAFSPKLFIFTSPPTNCAQSSQNCICTLPGPSRIQILSLFLIFLSILPQFAAKVDWARLILQKDLSQLTNFCAHFHSLLLQKKTHQSGPDGGAITTVKFCQFC